jgi:hypothetical protein
MILTTERAIWKRNRKDHINLEQKAVNEVRFRAAKRTGFTFNWLSGCGK